MKYALPLLLLSFFLSCQSNENPNSQTIVKADTTPDTTVGSQKDGWITKDADSINGDSAFYKFSSFLIRLSKNVKLEYLSGIDFRIYEIHSPIDSFSFYIGMAPDLPNEFDFLTESDSLYRKELLSQTFNHGKITKSHYGKEVNSFDSLDANKKFCFTKMYFEVFNQPTRKIWVKKPLTFNRKTFDMVIDFEDNIKWKKFVHIFGPYTDSTFNSALQFASTITPIKTAAH